MIRFLALGTPDLRGEEASELRAVLTQPRLLALLTYLAIARPRGFHRRDSLVAIFWPEVGHEQARNALRQVVHRLRRALGEDVVAGRGADELGLDVGRIWCDVTAFEHALGEQRVEDALEVYRGDLLPGFFLSEAPEFERWLDEERQRLRQRAPSAAWQFAEAEAAAGRAGSAAPIARRAALLSGDDEAGLQRHISLLARIGDRAGALRVYDAFARRLNDDLDIEPSSETQSLVKSLQVRTGAALSASASLGNATGVRSHFEPLTPVAIPHPDVEAEPPIAVADHHRSRWIMLGGIMTLMLAAVSTYAMVVRRQTPPPSRATVRTLAVFPFTVRGNSELSYLREGMVDLLSAKMNGTSQFRAIDPRGIIAAARQTQSSGPDIQQIASIGRRLGADWLLTGEMVEIAGRLQVSGTLYDVRKEPHSVMTASVAGEATDLFQLVDDLTGRILAGVAVGRDTALVRLSAITTHSLPALKAFLDGESALRAGQDSRA